MPKSSIPARAARNNGEITETLSGGKCRLAPLYFSSPTRAKPLCSFTTLNSTTTAPIRNKTSSQAQTVRRPTDTKRSRPSNALRVPCASSFARTTWQTNQPWRTSDFEHPRHLCGVCDPSAQHPSRPAAMPPMSSRSVPSLLGRRTSTSWAGPFRDRSWAASARGCSASGSSASGTSTGGT